jgi:tetratricopeptide (TPR) repeat protein
MNPQSDKYHYDLGLALERHNRPDEAQPFVEKAIQIKPGHSGAHYLLGKLHLRFGRLAEAVKEFEISTRLEPEPEFAYYQLARTCMRLGDAGRAQEWNAKLNEVKAAKDKRVGLAPPESATSNLLESVQPWESQGGGTSSRPSR